jgi:undecaprenyl diphosphate synthase
MTIIGEVIERETENLNRNGVQLRHIGRLEGLSEKLKQKVQKAIEITKDNDQLILNVAFNYGGRAEIAHAVRRIMEEGLAPEEITEDTFSRFLYTAGSPDPDLIIRTAGEMRLSNFLIWQGAYAEYWSTPTYWPDFDKEHLRQAIEDYGQRVRKFGRTPEQI